MTACAVSSTQVLSGTCRTVTLAQAQLALSASIRVWLDLRVRLSLLGCFDDGSSHPCFAVQIDADAALALLVSLDAQIGAAVKVSVAGIDVAAVAKIFADRSAD